MVVTNISYCLRSILLHTLLTVAEAGRCRAKMRTMQATSVIAPALICLVSMLCTSAIWIAVYYLGVKSASTTNEAEVRIVQPKSMNCIGACEFHLVESIPVGLIYEPPSPFMSTTDAWIRLIENASSTVDIASFYWSLLPEDTGGPSDGTSADGKKIFASVEQAGKRGVKIRVSQNAGKNRETEYLADKGLAQVRSLKFTNWLPGGILHTKAIVVDKSSFYVGSANMDWRSLTQVKELGVAAFHCPCLADDLDKILEVYWQMGAPGMQLPTQWPSIMGTEYNADKPFDVTLNTEQSAVYFSSAPPQFNPPGRQNDIDAILRVIQTAKRFIHIAVMDYVPSTLYFTDNKYWPVIDDALRSAAFDRHLHVKLLMSKWNHTRRVIFNYLRSLEDISAGLPCKKKPGSRKCFANSTGSIEVRLFEVPRTPEQSKIPFARVNHNKYMVTDNAVYIA
ncbi:hypothetical protein AB6A40_007992 [Gnathostoma spinigerum]|uniref:PLD phosphodiesterase domain-containing protein n=1 Tax=Gnathostoma spinigerum TaxID=75299 RepID=A0ABD6EW46_9BILA